MEVLILLQEYLKKKLINEIMITVEPKIFGAGLSLFNDDFDVDLELMSLEKINQNSFLVKYKLNYN